MSPSRLGIEGDVGQSIAEDSEKESGVTNEPALEMLVVITRDAAGASYKLKGCRKLLQSFSEGQGVWWRRGHNC